MLKAVAVVLDKKILIWLRLYFGKPL